MGMIHMVRFSIIRARVVVTSVNRTYHLPTMPTVLDTDCISVVHGFLRPSETYPTPEAMIVEWIDHMMTCKKLPREWPWDSDRTLKMVLQLPDPPIPFSGYSMKVDLLLSNLRKRRFEGSGSTEKVRSVRGIYLRVQHPELLRYGATAHHALEHFPVPITEERPENVVFVKEIEDIKHVRYSVSCQLADAFHTHIGIRNWEAARGGLRAAVVDHWSRSTPCFEDFMKNLQ